MMMNLKQLSGKKLYKKLENAQSTVKVIDSVEENGFKLQQRTVTTNGLNLKVNRMHFVRETDNKIENLSIETEEGYINGERTFYFDTAVYEWHYTGD